MTKAELRARNAAKGIALSPPPTAVAAPPAAPPCVWARELTGREREAAGKDHRKQWNWCDHPQDGRGKMNGRKGLPLAEKIVCPCQGCGPACPGYEADAPPVVVIDQGGSGIGDALPGLLAVAGFKRENPGVRVSYRVSRTALPYAALFHGYDELGVHARDHNSAPTPGAVQMNLDYEREWAGRFAAGPRWERYCRNIGAKSWHLPELRDPARVRALGAAYAGAVVLCPFSFHAEREWPLGRWVDLERRLRADGFRTVIAAGDARGCEGFRGELAVGLPADRVAGAFLHAALVVGNDSGPAHLAGILGRPTVAVVGNYPGERIFGCYPRVSCVGSGGPLASVSVETVWAACRTVLAADPPAARSAPRLATADPREVIRGAAEFPAEEFAALWASRDRHEDLAEWLARYAKLFEVVRGLAPRRVVEIGVRAGYSSWTICKAAPGASVIGFDLNVDPGKANSHGGYLNAWEHAAAINAGHNWHLVLCDSHKLDRLPACDLCYVDGDHTLAGATADLELAERSGATAILADDYATADLEVRAACDRFVAARPHLRGEFIDNGSTGLFLIRRAA